MNLTEKTSLAVAVLLAALASHALGELKPGIAIDLKSPPEARPLEIPDEVRRDATVAAVERAMSSVANIATETLVRVRDPFEDFFQEYWSPYHRRQQVRSQYNLGSGVMIDEDGYLLTNDHVVRRADKIQIQLATTREVYDARLVASDPRNDIALLKINAPPGTKFTAIKFAPEDDLLLGETVLALGNPFGLGGSVSRGILSSKNRVSPPEGQELNMQNWLQTDAAINPGNSGGPLVNLRGELIGLNVAVLDHLGGRIARGIGFAVPVRQVTEALANAFTPESASQLWFGARVKAGGGPLVVTSVQAGSPAAIAGLKVGDIVTQMNGKTPKSFITFSELLANSPNMNVALDVLRDGQPHQLRVRLVPERDFFNAELIQRRLGIGLQEITPSLAGSLGLPVKRGFIVAGTEPESAAAANLPRGAIITTLDDQLPADVVAFAKALHEKDRGDTARLGVIVQERTERGPFVQTTLRNATVELPVR